MIHINETHQSLVLPTSFPGNTEPTRRLIVPIPSSDADITGITQRVWELANATKADIRFIGICDDSTQESSLRRTLATMSAMVNYDNISAETEIIYGRDWVNSIKTRLQSGDMVICWEERSTGLQRKTLSPLLRSDLGVPLYLLSGLGSQNDTHFSWAAQAGTWVGFLAILIGLLFVQVKIYQFAGNWTIMLELLCTAVELWLIWFWNRLSV